MRYPGAIVAAFYLILMLTGTAFAGHGYQFSGTVDCCTRGAVLFRAFAEGLKPESMEMVLDEEPDETGRVRHLYLDLYGSELGGVRIDRLEIEAFDIQFTAPGGWEESGPDIDNMLSVNARAIILEEDINKAISDAAFGDDDGNWHSLSLDLRQGGVYARGNYIVKLLVRLDILIEIEGRFGIVGGKQVWLQDYSLKINRVDVPEILTERAIGQIQPIIDLNEFIFPLTLRSVIQKDDRVILESRSLPNPFEGIRYSFSACID